MDTNSYKILIVDDDVKNLDVIVNYLEESGKPYEILQALNGKMAYGIARNKMPDLIITDWVLPELDGLELIRLLKRDQTTKDIPIIMCTGIMTSVDNLETALRVGAIDYIRKPIDKTELIARIGSMLQTGNYIKEIKESELRYRSLFTNELDAICIYEVETRQFVDVNESFLKIYGYSREEIMQYKADDLSAEPEKTKKAIKQSYQDGGIFIPERLHKKKNGDTFWVELTGGPFMWKGQTLMYTVIRDITERKRYENELKRARDEAEMANRAKSIFLTNMSHELRTPLNAIIGFSEMMINHPNLNPEQLKNLQIIFRSGEHLLSLINDVLDFSKIEAGRIRLNQEDFDLYRLLLEFEEMFKLRTQQKGLALVFEQGINVPHFIHADRKKLSQIMINLLGNAVKFTETGGITLTVKRIEANKPMKPSECLLLFEVADTGIGISKEEQGKIFDMFFQSSALFSPRQGTGLGLPISQKLVNLLGGELEVNSEVGKGSRFTFTLPVACPHSADTEFRQQIPKVIALAEDQSDFRVLTVDDDQHSRNLLSKLLRRVGFQVQETDNGRDAIAMWREWQPHLIWMDMRMPIMDGDKATKLIKTEIVKSKHEIDTKIIAFTAGAFEAHRFEAIEHGCDDFLSKPFRASEIFDMMKKHLGVRYVYDLKDKNLTLTALNQQISKKSLALFMADVSQALILRLKRAVDLSDLDMIELLIEEIRRENVQLADALSTMAENFDYDTILDLIQQGQ